MKQHQNATPVKRLYQLSQKIPVLRLVIRFGEKEFFRRKWRKLNAHNDTQAGNIFPVELVTVGKMSYGLLNVLSWHPPIEKLQIGNYVLIAGNVQFLLSGNHLIDTTTNFPLVSNLPPPPHCPSASAIDVRGKGPIIIDDEGMDWDKCDDSVGSEDCERRCHCGGFGGNKRCSALCSMRR
jgi:hypothetical protein